jgi:ribosomal protein L37AE/L43A
MYNHQQIVTTYGRFEPIYNAHGHQVEPEKKEREKHFIKACPMKDCRGFLSTAYKCGICETHICRDCNEPKKDHKDDDHHCDPDKVASVKLIAKETTACPKCAIPVFKVSGCAQIWCTNCHTAFNHSTGVIETGVIHNPHYFEYMRKNNLAIPANPNAIIQDACGGANWAIQDRLILLENTTKELSKINHENYKHFKVLTDRYRQVNDAVYVHIRHLNGTIRSFQDETKKQKLRVLYLIKDIDEKKWKFMLQRDEKGLARERAKLQLLEMFVAAARQIFQEVIDNTMFNPKKMVDDLNNLMKFVNEQSQFILKDYQNTTPGYDYNWNDDMWTNIPCKKTKKITKKDSTITHVVSTTSDSDTSDSDSDTSDSDSDSESEDDGGAWGGAGVAPPKKK